MRKQPFHLKCNLCKETHVIYAYIEDVELWESGIHIQHAMPYLTADERELLISRTCGSCFDKMFT